MESDIDKLIKKLSHLDVKPNEDLFDNIYNKYNKRRRLLVWLLSSSFIGFAFVTFYFITVNRVQKDITERTSLKNESFDQIVDSNKTTCIKSLNQNMNNNILSKNKNLVYKMKDDNNSVNKIVIHNKSILNNEKKSKHNNEVNPMKGANDTTNRSADTLYPKNKNSNDKTIFNFGSDNQIAESQIIRTPNESFAERLSSDTISNQNSIKNIDILQPVMNKLIPIEIERSLSLPEIIVDNFNDATKSNIQTCLIEIYGDSGPQQFCSYASAQKTSFGFGLNYKLYKTWYIRLGMSRSYISYSFDFNNELLDRFGQTNKFPALPLINHKVEKILSHIDYNSFDLGLTTNLMDYGRHQIFASVRQEFISSTKQELNYKLNDNGQYLFLKTKRKMQIHQLISSMSYIYEITGNVGLGINITHNYSVNYLGIEREWYSGFNFGGHITFGF